MKDVVASAASDVDACRVAGLDPGRVGRVGLATTVESDGIVGVGFKEVAGQAEGKLDA